MLRDGSVRHGVLALAVGWHLLADRVHLQVDVTS